jgi:hypothetical protein
MRILSPQAAFDMTRDSEEAEPDDKDRLFHRFNARGTNDDEIASLEAYFSADGTGLLSLLQPAS